MKKMLLVMALVVLLLPFSAPAVHAAPVTLILEGGADLGSMITLLTLTDQGSGDLNLMLNALTYMGTLGGGVGGVPTFTFGAAVSGNSLPQPTELARLTMSTGNIASNAAGTLRMTLINSDLSSGLSPGYTGEAVVSARVGGRLVGPAGSTISVQSWVDPLDQPLPGSSAKVAVYDPGPFTSGPTGLTGSFLLNDTAKVNLTSSDFALFTQATVRFTGSGSTRLTFADIWVTPPPATAPEPASLLLISSAVLGLGAVARRRTKRRNEARVDN